MENMKRKKNEWKYVRIMEKEEGRGKKRKKRNNLSSSSILVR